MLDTIVEKPVKYILIYIIIIIKIYPVSKSTTNSEIEVVLGTFGPQRLLRRNQNNEESQNIDNRPTLNTAVRDNRVNNTNNIISNEDKDKIKKNNSDNNNIANCLDDKLENNANNNLNSIVTNKIGNNFDINKLDIVDSNSNKTNNNISESNSINSITNKVNDKSNKLKKKRKLSQ